jgi:hypothetical protein
MHKGDRYFCLAHLYIKSKHYRKFFKRVKKRGKFITLDNSAAERSLVTEDALIKIVKDLMPNEVIAPDVLFNKKATVNNLNKFIRRMSKEGLIGKVDILGCPQGRTKHEWLECYETMLQDPYVNVIGLSKISVPYCWYKKAQKDRHIAKARRICVKYLYKKGLLLKPIHCLGMGSPHEYKGYNRYPFLRSTDSCYTVLAAVNGVKFGKTRFKRIPTPHDYFEKRLTAKNIYAALHNIRYLQRILKKR